MSLKRIILATVAAASLFANAASATTATFAFTGTVTEGGTFVAAGSKVSGIFSYKMNALPTRQPKFDAYRLEEYDFSAPHILSAEVDGHSIITQRFKVTITSDFGGNVEDAVNITGTSVLVDDVAYPEGSFGFQLSTAPGNTGVLHNTRLPKSLDVEAFDAAGGMNYGWLTRDGSSNGGIFAFSIDRIETLSKTP